MLLQGVAVFCIICRSIRYWWDIRSDRILLWSMAIHCAADCYKGVAASSVTFDQFGTGGARAQTTRFYEALQHTMSQCNTLCCSVLQRVAVCCRVRCSVLQCGAYIVLPLINLVPVEREVWLHVSMKDLRWFLRTRVTACKPVCDMTHSYVQYDHSHVTWRICLCISRTRLLRVNPHAALRMRMWDPSHSYVWHDSFIFGTRLIYLCISHTRITACKPACNFTHSYASCVWHYSFKCVTWLINMWHGSFICVTWRSNVWHDSITCVTWLNHKWFFFSTELASP